MSADRVTRNWMNDRKPRKGRRGFELQEARAATAHPGGRQTRGSGCSQRPGRKGDSVGTYFRESSKTTERDGAKSIRIERAWLTEIEEQARATGHRPMLVFGFSADSENRTRLDWAGFPLSVAEDMTKACAALLDGDVAGAQELARLALGEGDG